jgi:hypothetical protein
MALDGKEHKQQQEKKWFMSDTRAIALLSSEAAKVEKKEIYKWTRAEEEKKQRTEGKK